MRRRQLILAIALFALVSVTALLVVRFVIIPASIQPVGTGVPEITSQFGGIRTRVKSPTPAIAGQGRAPQAAGSVQFVAYPAPPGRQGTAQQLYTSCTADRRVTATPTGPANLPATPSAPPAGPPITATPFPTVQAADSEPDYIVLHIIGQESEACYQVGEVFFDQNNRYALAVGVTKAISGEIAVDRANLANSKLGQIAIDISQFRSDERSRDGAIREEWLESNKFPVARLVRSNLIGLPVRPYRDGEVVTFQISGALEIRKTQREVLFTATAALTADTLVATAYADIKMTDFGVTPPNMLGLRANDEMRIVLNLVAREPKAPAATAVTAAPTQASAAAPTAAATQQAVCLPTHQGGTTTIPIDDAPLRASVGKGHTLSGVVQSGTDCSPIANAQIVFWLAGPNGEYDEDHRARVLTDKNGAYTFESNYPGTYGPRPVPHIHLFVSAYGYRSVETEYFPGPEKTQGTINIVLAPVMVRLAPFGAANCAATPGNANAQPADAPPRLSVGKGHLLMGVVQSSRGCTPIPNAKLVLWLVGPDARYDDMHRVSLRADSSGAYVFESNFPAQYGPQPHIHLYVSAPGHRAIETEVLIRPGATETAFNIVLAALAQTETETPTPIAQSSDARQIAALVENMQAAVLARDKTRYLSYVDLSDLVFSLEHRRWADDWAGPNPVKEFKLSFSNLNIDGNEAAADMSLTWVAPADRGTTRTATYAVHFRRDPEKDWRYAGESWNTTRTEHFLVRDVPGLEEMTRGIIAELPGIYTHVTSSLEYTPSAQMEIKLYSTSEALVANTLLSLPPIRGWNEPGEALKLWVEGGQAPPLSALAHEFTHFVSFEMAGTAHSRMPWWLEEGIAVYIGARYENADSGRTRLARVRDWAASGELPAWEKIADFTATPVELWQYVYPQGYAFVAYITETFGQKTRNAWLRAMASNIDLASASESLLKARFQDLNTGFLAWLKKQ